MSRIWYCLPCGYEVDSGGRCHNCKQPLISSPLEELSEGGDEVGYRLNDWDDAARGQLIETLVAHRIRHRFEGDELVVAVDDEEEVDAVVADLSGAASGGASVEARAAGPSTPARAGGSALDPAGLVAIEGLYDAAARLRADPTDMIADGDVAETSARVFALDHLYGVDKDTWAAVGRVTRRLLGALGAEEALDTEIGHQAAILCRLLEPVVARLERDDRKDGAPALDDRDDDRDDVDDLIYELEEWLPEERAELSLLLDRDRVDHEWEGSDLVVAEVSEAKVEALFDEFERTPPGGLPEAPEGADDEEEYQALSDLFGAADRLAGDPEDKRKRTEVLDRAATVVHWSTPVGMTDGQWWQIRTRSQALCESIELDASPAVVEDSATTLRNLLRQFV
jgi:hypothetical protein